MKTKYKPSTQFLLTLAVDSIKKTGGLALFWKYLHVNRSRLDITQMEAKGFIADYSSKIFRMASSADLSYRPPTYEAKTFGSGEWTLDYLAGVKHIGLASLVREIPNYLEVIKPLCRRVKVVEAVYIQREEGVVQPLFKVVAEFDRDARQLYIVGLDRHTKEPFALGVPNGFIQHPIDAALRWTMNVHKGDEVLEI